MAPLAHPMNGEHGIEPPNDARQRIARCSAATNAANPRTRGSNKARNRGLGHTQMRCQLSCGRPAKASQSIKEV